uniref:Glutamate receptor-like n=1 Tax=Hirondellea gigas TaxID=1518452 RepID=A0A2P2IAA8_9CRUS
MRWWALLLCCGAAWLTAWKANAQELSPNIDGKLNVTQERELEEVLMHLTRLYMDGCSVNIFYDSDQSLALVSQYVQQISQSENITVTLTIFKITEAILMDRNTWPEAQCDINVFLLHDGELLFDHASVNHFLASLHDSHPHALWNFNAKNILVALTSKVSEFNAGKLFAFRKSLNFLQVEFTEKDVLFNTNYPYQNIDKQLLASYRLHKMNSTINLFPQKFKTFNGSTIKVSTFEHPPSVLYIYDADHNVIKRDGVDMILIAALESALNFTAEYIEVNKGELWGHEMPNGTWDGLMGMLIYEKADVGACNVFIEQDRYDFIDFTAPFNFERGCFGTPSPKLLPRWTSPVMPFTSVTWASFAVAYLVGTALLYAVYRASYRKESIEYNSLSFDFLYVLGFMTMRSPYTTPSYPPLQIYLGFLWMFATLITIAYSANLVAYLSIVQKSPPIDTMKQLRESSLRLAGPAFWKTQFVASIDEDARSFENRLEPRYDLENVFKEVEAGEFAIIENKQFLELYVAGRYTYGDTATIRIVKQCLLPYSIGVGLQKFSPLQESFSKVVLSIVEFGLTQRWKTEVISEFRLRYLEEIALKTGKEAAVGDPLSIDHLLGVFMMYILGLILAALIFAGEILVQRMSK